MNEAKKPGLDHAVQDAVAARWSPYTWADRPVPATDLRAIFEAARWAPSAFNEQPWRYLVATREDPRDFARLLECLVEGNRKWALYAPVLALGVVSLNLARTGEPNRTAVHDLGLASAQLTLEAAARGLGVHQMGGILPEVAREVFAIPAGFAAFTGLAIGYAGEPVGEFAARDLAPRARRPQAEFVFGGAFGQPLAG
ncbi:MAG: nitroreductase family protein [bacterium]|nr:nitroreductase family protein [bacterium]